MKRLIVAAGLAFAALSVPATAALADGYKVQRKAPAPKPKPKPKAKAKKHHEVRARYCCERSHARVSFEQLERVESSYYEESDHHRFGPVVSYRESYVNPAQGCNANAPCTRSWGSPVPAEFYWGGHPGGVGYGVEGGHAAHHGDGAAYGAAYGMAQGYYGGAGYGYNFGPGVAYPPVYGHPGYRHPSYAWPNRQGVRHFWGRQGHRGKGH